MNIEIVVQAQRNEIPIPVKYCNIAFLGLGAESETHYMIPADVWPKYQKRLEEDGFIYRNTFVVTTCVICGQVSDQAMCKNCKEINSTLTVADILLIKNLIRSNNA